ncbi:chaperonin 10-like protein [Rhodotorula diobovata]|uniref:Chaperonin 10-like protein n=1 Tax=Rhodotorula diobovata TaxID=5288 RepID=A0A5C5FX61_9BASI|nr:chaperonin 10-like protein [Rhodotorula diobovata]
MSPDRTQKAVFVSKEGRDLVQRPIWSPGPGEVLIKNVCVSSNPKDWKCPLVFEGQERVEGNDVAGYVEAVGEGVTRFKKGDKVGAFTVMMTDDKYGAYAEYTISPQNTVFHLGPKTSFEDAAALPLAYITAAIGLFKRLKLPEPGEEGDRDGAVLVYGGATTVGVYALQLLKKAGFHVVAVAGASQDVAKAYGADEVIDYRGKSEDDLASAIAASHGGKGVTHVFDAVTEHGSTQACLGALVKSGHGGRYTYVLPVELEEFGFLPANIKHERTLCGTAHEDEGNFAQKWFDWVGDAIEKGEFRAQKVAVLPGGLEGVKEGLRRLQAGEVHGEKLVYRIKETPGLG